MFFVSITCNCIHVISPNSLSSYCSNNLPIVFSIDHAQCLLFTQGGALILLFSAPGRGVVMQYPYCSHALAGSLRFSLTRPTANQSAPPHRPTANQSPPPYWPTTKRSPPITYFMLLLITLMSSIIMHLNLLGKCDLHAMRLFYTTSEAEFSKCLFFAQR